jgi:hypothetical protein
MGTKRIRHKRFCYVCGSAKTSRNSKGCENWYNKPYGKDKPLCDTCYGRIIENPRLRKTDRYKQWLKRYQIKQFRFRDRRIHTDLIQRTGRCSQCPNNIFDGSCRRTNMHHWIYLTCLPWFGTQELCNRCHNIIHHAKTTS